MLYRMVVFIFLVGVSVSVRAGFWDDLQKAAEVIDAVNQEGQPVTEQQVSTYLNPADKQFESWVRMWENKLASSVDLNTYRDTVMQRNYFQFESMLKETARDFESRPGWSYNIYPDSKEQRVQQFSSCIAYEVSGDSRVSTSSYAVLATQTFRPGELAYDAAQNCLKAFTQAVVTENRFYETEVRQRKAEDNPVVVKKNEKKSNRAESDGEAGFMGITLGMYHEDALNKIRKNICPEVKMKKTDYLSVTRYYHFPACLELQGMKADLLISSEKYVNEIRVYYHQYNESVFKKLQKTLSAKYQTNYQFSKKDYGMLGRTGSLVYEIYEQGRVLLTVGGDGIQSSMSVWYLTGKAAAYKTMQADIQKKIDASPHRDRAHRKIDFDVF